VHLEEVDAENESNSFFLLEKEIEALPCHQLDIFSIEAPLNALEKLTHACMEKFEESDVKQLSDSILVHLGLIKVGWPVAYLIGVPVLIVLLSPKKESGLPTRRFADWLRFYPLALLLGVLRKHYNEGGHVGCPPSTF
jgi:hypothetical protein